MKHPKGEWEEHDNPDGALAAYSFSNCTGSLTTLLCKDMVSKIIALTLHHVIECKHHPGGMNG